MRTKIAAFVAAALGIAAWATAACACSTPVFRYALERWAADPLPVVVFHKGPLGAAETKAVEFLKAAGAEGKANLALEMADLNGQIHPQLKALWEAQADKTLPRMVLTYAVRRQMQAAWQAGTPVAQTDAPPTVWTGPVTLEAAKTVVDSPARRQVASRILEGQTTVWVLLECGKKDADDAAAKLLTEQLARLEKELHLPEADPSEAAAVPAPGASAAPALQPSAPAQDAPKGPPIKIAFSLLRIAPADAAEAVFVQMLLGLEKDLPESHKSLPLAYPMYGRGRALNPLVGKGINAENIQEYASALTAACSCEVKNENPGTDILVQADWDKAFTEGAVMPVVLPMAGADNPGATAPSAGGGLSETLATQPVRPPTVDPVPPKSPSEVSDSPATHPATASAPAKQRDNTWTIVVIITVLGVLVLTLFAAVMAVRKPRAR